MKNPSVECQGTLKIKKVPVQTEVPKNFWDVFPVLPDTFFFQVKKSCFLWIIHNFFDFHIVPSAYSNLLFVVFSNITTF